MSVTTAEFSVKPHDEELEKASNSYLMSLIAIMAGLPLPIINLIATVIFFFSNRSESYFVRWHCTQALLSQLMIFIMNSTGFSWTLTILFTDREISNSYIGYMITIFIFNVTDFISTLYTAIVTRKGKHVEWWFFGPLTNALVKK